MEMPNTRVVICVSMFFLLLTSILLAEDKKEDSLSNKFDSYLRYIPATSAKALSGKVSITQSEIEYSHEFKAFGKLPVNLTLNPEYIGIKNTTAVELPAQLTGVTADIEATFPFFNFNRTYMRVGLSPSFFGDSWNFDSSSFRIPSRYYVIYQPNEKWTFIGGVAFYPSYEDPIWPIAGFIYKPNKKLELNIIPDRPNISYLVNNRVTLFLEGEVSIDEYKVKFGNSDKATLRYTQSHLGAGVRFKLNKFIQITVSGGDIFDNAFRYRDSQGKVSLKNGPYTEFRIEAAL